MTQNTSCTDNPAQLDGTWELVEREAEKNVLIRVIFFVSVDSLFSCGGVTLPASHVRVWLAEKTGIRGKLRQRVMKRCVCGYVCVVTTKGTKRDTASPPQQSKNVQAFFAWFCSFLSPFFSTSSLPLRVELFQNRIARVCVCARHTRTDKKKDPFHTRGNGCDDVWIFSSKLTPSFCRCCRAPLFFIRLYFEQRTACYSQKKYKQPKKYK